MTGKYSRRKVVYLFGAGATHACVKAVGSTYGTLMSSLGPQLAEKVQNLLQGKYARNSTLTALVNTVVDENTDFEHVITFLDESASALHRRFADDLRRVFESVLRQRLDMIREERGTAPTGLYSALLDMYQVPGCLEELGGILTINYDEYIEEAVAAADGLPVDFGAKCTKPVHPSQAA